MVTVLPATREQPWRLEVQSSYLAVTFEHVNTW